MNGSRPAGSAVLIGAGIGGLSAAIGLQRVGWRVIVLERAADLGEAGAGILLMSNALRALDQLGISEALRAEGFAQASGATRTPSGRRLARLDAEVLQRRLGIEGFILLHRAELHRLLLDAVSPGTVLTGCEVVAVEPGAVTADGTAKVSYVTGEARRTLPAELVVAADGTNSRTRALLWPDAPGPVYSGATVWYGVTATAVPTGGEFSQSLGHGEEIGVMPMRDGRVCWHAVVTAPPGRRYADELAYVRRRFGSWHDPIPELLAATTPEAVQHHDLRDLTTPLRSYVRGRVVLLGDAAHPMTPYLGQGGCQAIEDAVVLAAALATEPDLPAALARYDRERRPRTQAITRASRLTGRIGQRLHGRLAVAARNLAFRVMPSHVAVSAVVRLADWTPPRIPRQGSATDRAV